MKTALAIPVLLLLCALTLESPALADPPPDTSFQGLLLDALGDPLAGPANLQIRIYDAPVGGALLYAEDHAGVVLEAGVFQVLIGAGAPVVGSFDHGLFAGMDRFIEVIVAGEVLAPRQVFSSVAYALQCREAASLQGFDAAALDQSAHVTDMANPHGVSAAQTGASTPAQVADAITLHAKDSAAHHERTTSFSTLTDRASDLQIPGSIARDAEVLPLVLAGDGSGSGLDADTVDGQHASAFATSDHAHFGSTWSGNAASGLRVANSSSSSGARGVQGVIDTGAAGAFSAAVQGQNLGTSGLGIGVHGSHEGTGWGVYGISAGGRGVYGRAGGATAGSVGVYGFSDSASGTGVVADVGSATGRALWATGGNPAIEVTPDAGTAIRATGTNDVLDISSSSGVALKVVGGTRAIDAQTTSTVAIYGVSTAPSGGSFPAGVDGWAENGAGVRGRGVDGILGIGQGTGARSGVRGSSTGTEQGRLGYATGSGASTTTYAVHGDDGFGTGTHWAGFFQGNVRVTGTLSKAAGSFTIDHPLDPANKLLSHSFVESPDMLNVYNGNVSLDAEGAAWVELPEWFDALNRDFRYQLTPIGAFAPLYVAEKISANRFRIAGGTPGLEVSWQVTGVRRDAWAEANRIPTEEDKPEHERGRYLHPAAFGLDESQAIGAVVP